VHQLGVIAYYITVMRRARFLCVLTHHAGGGGSESAQCVLLAYARAELLTSDHRPVYALYSVRSKCVIEKRRAAVLHDIYETLAKFGERACVRYTLRHSFA
jgi:hypothetical protein